MHSISLLSFSNFCFKFLIIAYYAIYESLMRDEKVMIKRTETAHFNPREIEVFHNWYTQRQTCNQNKFLCIRYLLPPLMARGFCLKVMNVKLKFAVEFRVIPTS